MSCNFTGFIGPKLEDINNIHVLNNKTIVDICFSRHEVLLNSKFNHINLSSASVNMKLEGWSI